MTTPASHDQEIARFRGEVGQHRTRVSFQRLDPDREIAWDAARGSAESAPDHLRGRLAPLGSPEDQYHVMVAVAAMTPAAMLRQAQCPRPDGHHLSLL